MASEDLPWFSTHPWELSQYAMSRPWDPYDEKTGTGRYKLVRELQKASRNEGFVSHYYDLQEQRDCAVKVVPLDVIKKFVENKDTENPLVDSGTLRYMAMFQKARYIAEWYDCGKDDKNMYFVSELGRIGDLFQFLQWHSRMSENEIKRYMYQVFDAIDKLHDARVCHLDLSVENVILRERNDYPEAMLIDFGMAERLIPMDTSSSSPDDKKYFYPITRRKGKSKYQDPCMSFHSSYDGCAADIFSIGAMMMILLVTPLIKDYPWVCTDPNRCTRFKYLYKFGVRAFLHAIEKKLVPHHPVPGENAPTSGTNAYPVMMLSDYGIDLLQAILHPNPSFRPSANQCKKHPWFMNDDSILQMIKENQMTQPQSVPPSLSSYPIIMYNKNGIAVPLDSSGNGGKNHDDRFHQNYRSIVLVSSSQDRGSNYYPVPRQQDSGGASNGERGEAASGASDDQMERARDLRVEGMVSNAVHRSKNRKLHEMESSISNTLLMSTRHQLTALYPCASASVSSFPTSYMRNRSTQRVNTNVSASATSSTSFMENIEEEEVTRKVQSYGGSPHRRKDYHRGSFPKSIMSSSSDIIDLSYAGNRFSVGRALTAHYSKQRHLNTHANLVETVSPTDRHYHNASTAIVDVGLSNRASSYVVEEGRQYSVSYGLNSKSRALQVLSKKQFSRTVSGCANKEFSLVVNPLSLPHALCGASKEITSIKESMEEATDTLRSAATRAVPSNNKEISNSYIRSGVVRPSHNSSSIIEATNPNITSNSSINIIDAIVNSTSKGSVIMTSERNHRLIDRAIQYFIDYYKEYKENGETSGGRYKITWQAYKHSLTSSKYKTNVYPIKVDERLTNTIREGVGDEEVSSRKESRESALKKNNNSRKDVKAIFYQYVNIFSSYFNTLSREGGVLSSYSEGEMHTF